MRGRWRDPLELGPPLIFEIFFETFRSVSVRRLTFSFQTTLFSYFFEASFTQVFVTCFFYRFPSLRGLPKGSKSSQNIVGSFKIKVSRKWFFSTFRFVLGALLGPSGRSFRDPGRLRDPPGRQNGAPSCKKKFFFSHGILRRSRRGDVQPQCQKNFSNWTLFEAFLITFVTTLVHKRCFWN